MGDGKQGKLHKKYKKWILLLNVNQKNIFELILQCIFKVKIHKMFVFITTKLVRKSWMNLI